MHLRRSGVLILVSLVSTMLRCSMPASMSKSFSDSPVASSHCLRPSLLPLCFCLLAPATQTFAASGHMSTHAAGPRLAQADASATDDTQVPATQSNTTPANTTAGAANEADEVAPGATTQTAPLATETTEAPATNATQPLSSAAPSNASPDAPATSSTNTTATGATANSAGATRLYADIVRYEGGLIVAESRSGQGVRLEGPQARIYADGIELNVANRTVRARGRVRVERTRQVERNDLLPVRRRQILGRRRESLTETLRGEDFQYSFATRQGTLDRAQLQLNGFDVQTTKLLINGRKYTASDVILRPGGLSDADRKIYGTPPFSIRARTITVESLDASRPANRSTARSDANASGPESGGGTVRVQSRGDGPQVVVKGGALFYKNTRLVPVPSYVFRSLGGGSRDQGPFSLTPRLAVNSTDGLLLTTRVRFPLSKDAAGLGLNADIGASTRVGFRGGLSLEAPTGIGTFLLNGRVNDIVTTQLTNRILLNRQPQLSFSSRLLPLFRLPGGHQAGLRFTGDLGRFAERGIDLNNDGNNRSNDGRVSDTRRQAGVRFTTRANELDGPYLDLFARVARYGQQNRSYRNLGYEMGYAGSLGKRVRGQFSFRSTSLSGQTPFRFDRVEIARELRTTFDIELSPRYLLPVDLRYDLSQKRLRDQRFGLLRSYKTFAYGFTYQTARRELQFELRSGF